MARHGERCPAKDVNGDDLETLIWADVEGFLRDPGSIIEQLREKLAAEQPIGGGAQQVEQFERALEEKASERTRILGLFRRARINEAELDEQLNEIQEEETGLREAIGALARTAYTQRGRAARLRSTGALRGELGRRLQRAAAFDLKRQL